MVGGHLREKDTSTLLGEDRRQKIVCFTQELTEQIIVFFVKGISETCQYLV